MIDVLAHNHAPDETWVLEWLSSPRLQTYLDASGNNLQRALRLYEWNINLGQINGKDLMDMGVPQGKEIGQILSWLLDQVLEDPQLNERETLTRMAEEKRDEK